MTIEGKVVYEDIGPGCWGIVDAQSKQWRPVNMPEQLKKVGASVRIKANEVEEFASVFMWGTPVHITSFHTLNP